MNPAADNAAADARREYESFHWGRPSRTLRPAKVSPQPATLAQLGKLEAIVYSTRKGRDYAHWEHKFGEDGGAKPVLAMDPRSRRLHIVGGGYRIERRGIVD